MTYDALIERIRLRAKSFIKGTLNWETGAIYTAANDVLRDILRETKDSEATATLSLVAGTRDYTVSSAIGSDVGDIHLLQMDVGEIKPATVPAFQNEIFKNVKDENDISNGTPRFYRVWNGSMRIYPTPDKAKSVTVYYTKKTAPAYYSTTNGTASLPIDDSYLSALEYGTIALLCESEGLEQKATYYHGMFEKKLREAILDRSYHDDSTVLTYYGTQ